MPLLMLAPSTAPISLATTPDFNDEIVITLLARVASCGNVLH